MPRKYYEEDCYGVECFAKFERILQQGHYSTRNTHLMSIFSFVGYGFAQCMNEIKKHLICPLCIASLLADAAASLHCTNLMTECRRGMAEHSLAKKRIVLQISPLATTFRSSSSTFHTRKQKGNTTTMTTTALNDNNNNAMCQREWSARRTPPSACMQIVVFIFITMIDANNHKNSSVCVTTRERNDVSPCHKKKRKKRSKCEGEDE
jgi:hypothetical protein